jgi:periplasmic copper chaperone A
MHKMFAAIAALVVSVPVFAHDFRAGPIEITHPWSRATAAKAQVGAGFLKLSNTGRTTDRLVAVKSAVSSRVEIHTMTMEGGVMRMRELKSGLTIPPGAEVILQPGAEHIMFMGLNGPITHGADFKATLVFERAGEVEVTFKVEAMGSQPAASSHSH